MDIGLVSSLKHLVSYCERQEVGLDGALAISSRGSSDVLKHLSKVHRTCRTFTFATKVQEHVNLNRNISKQHTGLKGPTSVLGKV